jgi:proteic killer suppression protein
VTIYALRCILVIRRFKHRGPKRLYERGDRGGIGPNLLDTVEDILVRLDEAETPQAMNLPGYRLHPLKGGLKGFWSVTVWANWRIIFRFEGADAFDVELTGYR